MLAAPAVTSSGSFSTCVPTGKGCSSGSATPRPGLDFSTLLRKVEQAQSHAAVAKKSSLTAKRGRSCAAVSGSGAKKRRKKSDPQELPPSPASMCTLWSNRLAAVRSARQIVVGIDMSLTNPGLCLLDPCLRTIHLWCFRNRVKDSNGMTIVRCPNSLFDGWLFQVTVIEEWPDVVPQFAGFSLPRFSRYETRIQSLLGIVGEHRPDRQNIVVGIEHYAFSATATRGDSTLKELGGILRRQLCHMNHRIVEIVPSQVKRIFCNQGDAKKKDMYRAYDKLYCLPDLFTMMGIKRGEDENGGLEKPFSDKPKPKPKKSRKKPVAGTTSTPLKPPKAPRKKRSHDDVPHPIEDMVDALGVAMAVISKMYGS